MRTVTRVGESTWHNVCAQIEAEAIAQDTLEFVRVRSETGEEGDGSRFLADLLRREGFEVRLDEIESGRPNVYSTVPHAGATTGDDRALVFTVTPTRFRSASQPHPAATETG